MCGLYILASHTPLKKKVLYAEAERLVKEILPGCSNINDLIAAHERFIASVYNKCLLHGNVKKQIKSGERVRGVRPQPQVLFYRCRLF